MGSCYKGSRSVREGMHNKASQRAKRRKGGKGGDLIAKLESGDLRIRSRRRELEDIVLSFEVAELSLMLLSLFLQLTLVVDFIPC